MVYVFFYSFLVGQAVLNKLPSLKQLANGVASSDEELCKGLAYPTRLDTARVVGYYHLLSFRVIMLSEWKSRQRERKREKKYIPTLPLEKRWAEATSCGGSGSLYKTCRLLRSWQTLTSIRELRQQLFSLFHYIHSVLLLRSHRILLIAQFIRITTGVV